MDFLLFHLDGMGNRMLIAIIAIVHVVINHPMAVGIYPLITILEYVGIRQKDERYDVLAKKMTFVVFIITTTLGALTGVGIWFSTAIVSPFAIGSLLRVFFWGWAFEWIVFVAEVILLLVYYLTWETWREGNAKKQHLALGVTLSIASWLTMAIIVAILGFMMSSGVWPKNATFWSAFLNPLYLPQLAFRTCFAMVGAGLFAWFLTVFFTRDDREFQSKTVRRIAIWTMAWLIPCLAAAYWYWTSVPQAMAAQVGVGIMTQQFVDWSRDVVYVVAGAVGAIALTAGIGIGWPRRVPRVALLVPFVLAVWMLGHFERVREFIRKPYVIANYMYSNGVRVHDLPIYQKDGILTYAEFAAVHEVTDDNQLVAGHEVFMLSCSRCHTTRGMNGLVQKFEGVYGEGAWDPEQMANLVRGIHISRPYMPPFPGNQAELGALVTYVRHLRDDGEVPQITSPKSASIPGHPRKIAARSESE